MEGSVEGAPVVWDGRGGLRPERRAQRRRQAIVAATVAMMVAVPTVVGSSFGWWSGTAPVAAGAEPAIAGAEPGSSAGEALVGGEGGGGGVVLVPDPLDPGAAIGEPGLVGIGGGLLDAGVDPGDDCTTGPPGEPIVVGVLTTEELTGEEPDPSAPAEVGLGSVSPTAVEVEEVGRYLVGLVNCAGGVLGRPVEVMAAEAVGSPLATNDAVAELVDRGVSAIIAPSSLEVTIAAADATAGRVPVLVPWSIEPALDDQQRGLFLIDPDATTLAAAAAAHARDRGWSNAVLVEGSDPLADLAMSRFADGFVSDGGAVAAEVSLVVAADGSVDLGSQLDRFGVGPLAQAPPDVIVTATGVEVLAGLRQALAAAGVEVPVLAIDRREPSATWASLDLPGVEVVGRHVLEPDGRVTLLESVVGGIGEGQSVDSLALARFADAVLIAVDAVDRAGSAEPDAVAESLREPRAIDGVRGPMGVWPGRDAGAEPLPIPVAELLGGRARLVAELAPPFR